MPSVPTVIVQNPKKPSEPKTINQSDYLAEPDKYVLWDVVKNRPVGAPDQSEPASAAAGSGGSAGDGAQSTSSEEGTSKKGKK